MNRLTPLQREAAHLLFGLPESAGFALAGGSALVALGVIDRPARDLDAFIAAQHEDPPGDVRPLVVAYESALVGLDPGVTYMSIAHAVDQLARLRDDELPCPQSERADVRQWFAGAADLRRAPG